MGRIKPMWHGIIRGTAVNFLGMILSTVINFALVVMVIDYYGFGVSGYLVLFNLLGVTGLIGLLDGSVPFISNRVFSKYKGNSKKFLKLMFSFYSLVLLCVSLLCLLISCGLMLAIQPTYLSIFLLIGISYPIVFQGLIARSYFLSRKNFLVIQVARLFTDVLRLGGLMFTTEYADAETYFFIYILVGLIPTMYLIFLSIYKIGFTSLTSKCFAKLLCITFGEAKFHFAGRVGAVTAVNAERLVFSTQDVSLLGVVDALMKIPNLITGLSGVAVSTVVPFVANRQGNGIKKDTLLFYIYGQTVYISIIVFLATFFIFNAEFILVEFFNLGSNSDLLVFGSLLAACVFNCLQFGANFLLALKTKLEEVTKYRISFAFFKVLSNALLLAIGLGANAIGYTALMSCFLVVIILVAIKKTFEINMHRFLWVLIFFASFSFLSCFMMATFIGHITSLTGLIYTFVACGISYICVMTLIVMTLKKIEFKV